MPTLREIGEHGALHRLIGAPARSRAGVVVDAGDDAAVLRLETDRDLVATTDAFVEDRHYTARFPGREIGARLACANLSDLAAMAAKPRWALLSAAVRRERDLEVLLEVQSGLADELGREGAVVVGGNLVAVAGGEWWSLTLLGEVPRDGAWTRAGARPGDLIAVTGHPGRAAAGLRLARERGGVAADGRWRPLLDAWMRPRARVALALELVPTGAVTAAIDLSDGVAGDLARLCEASGVGADLDESAWPPDPLLEGAAAVLGIGPWKLWLGASDDYELLLAIDPARRAACEKVARDAGVAIAFVGRLTESREIRLVGTGGATRPLPASGFDHFA